MNKMKAAKFFLGIATIALGLSLSSQAQDAFTNGLVVYYPFHGNANDAWGSQDGELNGNVTPTANRFDEPGMACNFDGTAYVDVPDAEALHLQAMTLSRWALTTNCRFLPT